MNQILKEVIAGLLEGGRVTVALDGMCASGKSTLADEIQDCFGGTVIRADSFFLPEDMRTQARMSTPGGNFHRERFYTEVVQNLKTVTPFSYGVFDCKRGEITHSAAVDEARLIIIEGSYCMHPDLCADYDLKIFCLTDERTQLSRIEKRNGITALPSFKSKWIPLENNYFQALDIQKICDITVVT